MRPRKVLLHLAVALITLSIVLPAALLAYVPRAEASLARALRLRELVRQSQNVVVGMPAESWSRWEDVGPSRRIVTYTRVLVEQTVAGERSEAEIMVRTLGGRVGKIGQVVYGEATLSRGERSVLFVRKDVDGTFGVTGRAQGHFLLRAADKGVLKLVAGVHLSELVGTEGSAVLRLHGQTLSDSQRLILEAARK